MTRFLEIYQPELWFFRPDGPPPSNEQRAWWPKRVASRLSYRNTLGRHYVGGFILDPRDRLRIVKFVLRQHQRQDFRNVPNIPKAITTFVSNCQVHGNLPGTTFVCQRYRHFIG